MLRSPLPHHPANSITVRAFSVYTNVYILYYNNDVIFYMACVQDIMMVIIQELKQLQVVFSMFSFIKYLLQINCLISSP